ncbi:hypothetical protein [Sphingomonas faeni]|uniref:hypothetical protein n=1 Tax=Sphingomonas faeni TaxID=185950 RepID=UPI00336517F4
MTLDRQRYIPSEDMPLLSGSDVLCSCSLRFSRKSYGKFGRMAVTAHPVLAARAGTVLSWLPDVALQPLATALAPAIALVGVLVAARLLYRSTVGVARRNLLVGTVTTERATWRSEMRTKVSRLVLIARSMPASPTRQDLARFDRVRVEVRLRLNPSLKPADLLDQQILAALKSLRDALVEGEQVRIDGHIETIECKVQELLKKEWTKSKDEARTGELSLSERSA